MPHRRHRLWPWLVVVAALLALLRPRDDGAPHDPYFAALQRQLKQAGLARPVLLLDRDRFDANLDVLMTHLRPPRRFRVVVKSLPSPLLLARVFERTGARAAMVFDVNQLQQMLAAFPDVDILLGKPMPVSAAAEFFARLPSDAAGTAERRVQWLIDSHQRLGGYAELARGLQRRLRVNLEIDVGLHRGGFALASDMAPALKVIVAEPQALALSGFMGYDAHVAHAPPLLSSVPRALAEVESRYRGFVAAARAAYPDLITGGLTYNGAGSKTYQLYGADTILNDFAVGSSLLLPTDFDVATIVGHVPALFIATPVLKVLDGTTLPFLEWAGPFWSWYDRNRQQTLFVYGGKWMAQPVSPAGLRGNAVFGQSSNQDVLNGSRRSGLAVDDVVFYRPTQSEEVLLEFGDIRVVQSGKFVDRWPVFARE